MKRREFIGLIGGAATVWPPLSARAQQPRKIPRLAILLFNSPQIDPIGPLLQGLQALGYVDGTSIAIEYRYAEGKVARLPDLASELVQLKPNVIFAYGGDVAPHAKRATASIPIVVMVSNDPVQSGLVTSISRPGGNVTGITLIYDDLAGKMLELLKEAMPEISRVAVLWNPDHADPEYRETQRVAVTRGVQLQPLPVRRPDDFDEAFKSAIDGRAEGLIVVSTRLLLTQRQKIIEFAINAHIAAVGNWGDWAKDGLLLTYGPNTDDAMRGIATYVDKILKGAQPADLPVERPTRFELVINSGAAQKLGVTFPNSILARADKVIE
jgi:putative ABC transport system substrate-binding protein